MSWLRVDERGPARNQARNVRGTRRTTLGMWYQALTSYPGVATIDGSLSYRYGLQDQWCGRHNLQDLQL